MRTLFYARAQAFVKEYPHAGAKLCQHDTPIVWHYENIPPRFCLDLFLSGI
jgi:hypothetical protein